MNKLKLNLNELKVESFETRSLSKDKGTVAGNGFISEDGLQSCICSVGLQCESVIGCTTKNQIHCDIDTYGWNYTCHEDVCN